MSCVDFADTTADYIQLLSDFGIQGGNMTMGGWFSVQGAPSASEADWIIELTDATNSVSLEIYYFNNAGTFELNYRRNKPNVGATTITVATTLAVGQWYHIVMTYDGTNIQGWLDGVSQ